MIYDIRHVTTYKYQSDVTSARCTLRLLPRNDGGQIVEDSGLDLSPHAEIAKRIDFFGNRIATARITIPHRQLRVTAMARVVVDRKPSPAPGLTPGWNTIRDEALGARSLEARSPAHHIFPSRLVTLHAPITAYAKQSFGPDTTILEGALDLMTRIYKDFKYDPKATAISTPLEQAFAKRGGVCQDFAHIMIAGLRGLGLPAAYISGYIRTITPPGQKRLEGADASHAWVSIWMGPTFGWLDLDPTNDQIVANDHIVLAIGRDYADVSPINGVLLGSGSQKLSVSVDVKPVN